MICVEGNFATHLRTWSSINLVFSRFKTRFTVLHTTGRCAPVYEWSRRVEYPFAVHSLASRPVGRTLDAGSGVTFFPLYLRQEWGVPVACLDYKAAYVDRMNQVGQLFDLKDAIPFHVAERWQGTADPRGT